ncbi:hypothetical protein Tco_0859702 [Tanacetum coccineum]|uniref:Uncharacterized protein n=1 Tax=Tanacetum coccineum TaxID=301880 RepID=A0ABQ5BCT0_9ASTR
MVLVCCVRSKKVEWVEDQAVISANSVVTYTSVHSEAQLWSIPSEDPYEKAARQLLEQAPCSPEYVPDPMELEDYVPVYIPEPKHPEDLVLVEDEAPIKAYITEVPSAPTPPLPPPSFLPSLIRPPRTRAVMAQIRAATPSTYHPLLPSWTSLLLPIPLPAPSTSHIADILEADSPPRKRLLLTAPRPRGEVGESSAAVARQPGPTMAHVHKRESSEFYSRHHDAQNDRASVRVEIKILRRERLAYEQESINTRQALARIMALVNQGMSVEEIEQIVAQRVANAIEAIAKTNQTARKQSSRECASFTTLACVRQGVKIASGGVTKTLQKGLSTSEVSEPCGQGLVVMTIGLDLPTQIMNAQTGAQKPENLKQEDVGGMIRNDIPKEELEIE